MGEYIEIIGSIGVLGGLGLIFGIILSYAGKIFTVEEDPVMLQIREILPGANCGGCGFTGCDLYAQAVAEGKAKAYACTVGGAEATLKISEILGVEAEIKEKEVAYVKCRGDSDISNFRYNYQGINSCEAAMQLSGGGPKACPYGCLGCGSCTEVCKFGAINIVNGIAFVNRDLCTACGQCAKTCPKKIIEIVPFDNKAYVGCSSIAPGKVVKENCSIGCIGCKICVKNCPNEAIQVENFISHVDYEKCTGCNQCVEKCPVKVINPSNAAPTDTKTA